MKNIIYLLLAASLPLVTACGSNNDDESQPHPPPPTATSQGEADLLRAGYTYSGNKEFAVRWQWLSEVRAQQLIDARMSFVDANGLAASSISGVTVEPWMPSMGHGTAMDDQVISQEDNATFLVKGIYLIMGGPWEIKINAALGQRRDTALIAVRVP